MSVGDARGGVLFVVLVLGCVAPAPFVPARDVGPRDGGLIRTDVLDMDAPGMDAAGLDAPTDAAVRPDTGPATSGFGGNDVLVYGPFVRGTTIGSVCPAGVSRLQAVSDRTAALDCAIGDSALARDGTLYYAELSGRVRRFVPDAWSGDWSAWPENPRDNDPEGTACNTPTLSVDPDDNSLVIECECPGTRCRFIDGAGAPFPAPTGAVSVAPGFGPYLLFSTSARGAVQVWDGAAALPVMSDAIGGGLSPYTRAREDGFRYVQGSSLFQIAFDGSVTSLGDYSAAPAEFDPPRSCVLTPDDAFYCIASTDVPERHNVVLRYRVGMGVDVVRDERDGGAVVRFLELIASQ